ncbi:hypothetical protein [Hyalangium sp.]|uniref:hypothetical protein n=1 Tax=Hyalangium sp. TaxID=2028555 RepID=UPI002D6E4EC8|nr:hypothetical protein [Hyalangium sp.]HYH94531.1 hypothetical protein [Hyalangium sp.]
MNALRIIALSVLLAAGGSLAEDKNQKRPPKPDLPKPVMTAAQKPETCSDQCKLMETAMVEPCKKGAGKSKSAQKSCEKRAQKMVDVCYGSCAEKGRIDKQYMLERIKPPAGYKVPQEGAHGSGQEGGDDH